ncbi:hypothetical protein GCM10007160_36520 [Litchfieldella qijiaojingensis]|uniref:Uncharacterized protein n=1 Tax=Litchfieldella qijiaojingensis TaxID=980347 RepID=A0ABQ2Z6W0_9GAMM|nr:hypothetical protein [Halomonas qijiaojingensis]GGY05552.1 hypothetical protein GCM10007160_36520 [Halomonas qijiaojingensis]
MAHKKREPLSDEETEFLTHPVNGTAMAGQRKRDWERAIKQNRRPH